MKIRGKRRQRGQGMTEYIIIVAVVAVLSLAIIMKFGNQIRELFWGSGKSLVAEDVDEGVGVTDRMGEADEAQRAGLQDL